MQILLTGASSFTGFWFASELSRAGHAVTAAFRQRTHQGTRGTRVGLLRTQVTPAWEVPFGSPAFLELLEQKWDLFCHHGSIVDNYRSWDFNPIAATQQNTANLRNVLSRLAANGCRNVVFTGSVFEPYEGKGDPECRAFSPYGLSKHMSFELFRLECRPFGLGLHKFVIPNPFGPYEELRFTSHAVREWSEGRIPVVYTPDYVRDNIHVSLLAQAYRRFCEAAREPNDPRRCAPSGYVDTQGAFARRFAEEIGSRLGRDLRFELQVQAEFAEPRVRFNSQPAVELVPEWTEEEAWTDLSRYYLRHFFAKSLVNKASMIPP